MLKYLLFTLMLITACAPVARSSYYQSGYQYTEDKLYISPKGNRVICTTAWVNGKKQGETCQ